MSGTYLGGDNQAMRHWFAVTCWFQQQRTLLDLTTGDAVNAVQRRWSVSRATAYRWVAAWREIQATEPT